MGFIRRLNSKELVGDPCAGAEVYPITATNAVYREGGENLEDILTNLGNSIDRNVVSDVTLDAAHNKIIVSYTNNTTADITYDAYRDVRITDTTSGTTKTYTIYFKKPDNTEKSISFTIEQPTIDYPVTDVKIRNTSVVTNKIADMDIVKNNNTIYAVQYIASEQAYQSMTKDPNTLYFIPVENS